ncbi:dTDP-4-dehydrorhamnose reductase [bacterium]|nr:MAG: dTDP-4-dehydrorhamnose reductase [bacterium]
MRILIVGAGGQLGRALRRRALGRADLARGHGVVACGRGEMDVTDLGVRDAIAAAEPDVVINAAAMTDVDGCERDPDEAFRVNALGARNVALGAALAGADLVHISTDFVFDGGKGDAYWEFDRTAPISVYGASKLAGEEWVGRVHDRVYIARTAWLYGIGGRNFVTRILDLAAERPSLEVVDNEVGNPTFCDDLADAVLALVHTRAYGICHLVNEGACSRHAFARAILDLAGRPDYPIHPVDHYPRLARAPSYAPLRNFAAAQAGVRLPPWQDGLARYFERQALVADG